MALPGSRRIREIFVPQPPEPEARIPASAYGWSDPSPDPRNHKGGIESVDLKHTPPQVVRPGLAEPHVKRGVLGFPIEDDE